MRIEKYLGVVEAEAADVGEVAVRVLRRVDVVIEGGVFYVNGRRYRGDIRRGVATGYILGDYWCNALFEQRGDGRVEVSFVLEDSALAVVAHHLCGQAEPCRVTFGRQVEVCTQGGCKTMLSLVEEPQVEVLPTKVNCSYGPWDGVKVIGYLDHVISHLLLHYYAY